MKVPVEAMSDSRAIAQPYRPESAWSGRHWQAAAVQRVSMMKRAAVVDYGIDYGLHNMHGTAGLCYVSNPVSCIIIYARIPHAHHNREHTASTSRSKSMYGT